MLLMCDGHRSFKIRTSHYTLSKEQLGASRFFFSHTDIICAVTIVLEISAYNSSDKCQKSRYQKQQLVEDD